MAEESTKGWYSEAIDELIELAADYQQITPDRATGLCHSWTAEAARSLTDLTMPLSAYSLMNPIVVAAETPVAAAKRAATPKPATKKARAKAAPAKKSVAKKSRSKAETQHPGHRYHEKAQAHPGSHSKKGHRRFSGINAYR